MSLAEQLFFPTPIYTGRLDDRDELNPLLLELIYQERERDPDGDGRSNIPALDGWHSHVNLHKDEAYAQLVAAIEDELACISEDSGFDPGYRLNVETMWAIINGPGSANMAHIHPKSHWSGVYYIQTPEHCGNIEFTDPRTMLLMDQPTYIPGKTRKKSRWTKVNFTPEPGKLVIFPSWLYHSVPPNLSDQTGKDAHRVIISFNASQRKKT